MTLLCLTSTKLRNLMNQERLEVYQALEKRGAIIHCVEEQDNANYDLPTLIKNYNQKLRSPITAITFEQCRWLIKLGFDLPFKNAHKVALPKASFIDDYWHLPKDLKKYIKTHDITAMITPHDMAYPYFKRHFPELENLIFAPFCINASAYKAQPNKTLDVLNTNGKHEITPFRNRLYDLLPRLKDYDINFYQLEHPGKRTNEKTTHAKQSYLELLHQASFVIADTTMFNISVRKYQEIMAAGATIIGNETGLPEHDFVRENIVRINQDMSDEQILETIQQAVQKKSEYERKALELSQQTIQRFSADTIAQTIEESLCTPQQKHLAALRITNFPKQAREKYFWKRIKIQLVKIIRMFKK